MTRLPRVEKRLFEAVVLVLASAGCYTTTPPPRYQRQPQPPPPPPPSDVAADPDPWSAAAPSVDPSAPPPPPNAQAICAKHKRTPLDARKTPPAPSSAPTRRPVSETSHWNPVQNAANCTLVRDRRSIDVTVTYTPRCCPSPDLQQQPPCPGPQTSIQQTSLLLVERADVAPDGTVMASNLTWTAIEPYQQQQPYCGRVPEGAHALGEHEPHERSLPHHLAAMAELELASIHAFERLALELAAHGAPATLVRRAHVAMRDEIRHARAIGALATRYGSSPRRVEVDELPCRSLFDIAIENVIEGCVREAYGALIATYQAECAAPHLRPVFRAVARDERRHASLAEDVHAWIVERLDATERASVEAARRTAEAELRANLPSMSRCEELGMPEPQHAIALFEAYFASA